MTHPVLAAKSSSAPCTEFLHAQDVFAAFDTIEARRIHPKLTMLDPWYNKGTGGIIEEYDAFVRELLRRACAISEHVYLWGFPEILGPHVRSVPTSHQLVAWLTWFYKNNPSVIRGWRSSQMACLHLVRPGAKLYPENFLNTVQKKRFAEGTLRYVPGPTSVIEAPLLIGFVGRGEQTGHPAQKPLAVFDKLIRMVTTENDLIFDPMCGSGTTGAIALIRDRIAIQSDVNPDYLKIAKERLSKNYSGWATKLDVLCNNRDIPRRTSLETEQEDELPI